MKKIQNKKGILLTEILIAMVLIVLIVVGGFQAVKSWKNSAHLHNTVKQVIQHIPSTIDQIMTNKGIEADAVTIADIQALTSHATKTSWGTAGSIAQCGTTTTGEFCLNVILPDDAIATDFESALAKSTGSTSALDSVLRVGAVVTVKYAR